MAAARQHGSSRKIPQIQGIRQDPRLGAETRCQRVQAQNRPLRRILERNGGHIDSSKSQRRFDHGVKHSSGVDNVDATMMAVVPVHGRDYATRHGSEAYLALTAVHAAQYHK